MASCRDRAVAASAPSSRRVATKALTVGRSSVGGRPVWLDQAMKRRMPLPYVLIVWALLRSALRLRIQESRSAVISAVVMASP